MPMLASETGWYNMAAADFHDNLLSFQLTFCETMLVEAYPVLEIFARAGSEAKAFAWWDSKPTAAIDTTTNVLIIFEIITLKH
jgi:hypothetical protein